MSSEPSRKSFLRTYVQDNALIFLLAYRLLNSVCIKTFFQPDEYYQALEPAWRLAFGDDSGAWITWEWHNRLRSAIHPALFACVYRAAGYIASNLHLSKPAQIEVLLVAPKTLQACIAALGDYYTYKLAKQIYGKQSPAALITLILTVGSAWQWFCATRTFSNCAETTLTVIGLYNWPFHWSLGVDEVPFQVDMKSFLRIRETEENIHNETDELTRLRRALFCAAVAVILRPTNVIVWLCLIIATFGRGIWHHGMAWEINVTLREGLLCGGTVLTLSALTDRIFYKTWAFPPWNFLKFNVLQSLAVFYGNNDWHYYLSQGYPLLLTVAIVPAVMGLYQRLARRAEPEALSIQSRLTLHRLAVISIGLPLALSVLSHKEVRFLHPILPGLHILAAMPLAKFFGMVDRSGREVPSAKVSLSATRRLCLVTMITVNVSIALYTSLIHNSGIIAVTDYFRTEYESLYVPEEDTARTNLTFAMLMPCHSTPWRSHLQYPASEFQPGISGWALTCEPPLNLNLSAKAAYLDEADIFYLDPLAWINKHMSRDVPPASKRKAGIYALDPSDTKKLWSNSAKRTGSWLQQGEGGLSSDINRKKRAWPDYIAFFQHLEPVMKRVLDDSAYRECRRLFNSHAHDDWRRTGDVVVWCLHPEITSI